MKRATAFAAAALLAAPLAAHDFWIEPSSFRPEVGSVVGIQLVVGQKFRGEPLPRNPALIAKFVLISGGLSCRGCHGCLSMLRRNC